VTAATPAPAGNPLAGKPAAAKPAARPPGGPPEASLASSTAGLLALSTGRGAVAAPAVAAAGVAFLLLRPSLEAFPRGGVALLAAGYLAVGALAARQRLPAPKAEARQARAGALPALPALAVGIAAVAVAALLASPAPALPGGAAPTALALDLLAAGAEEALFRRLLFGWLARWGLPVAAVGSATAFALVHVPLYGMAALPVDFGAGLLFSWQRAATGRWAVPAATHAAANLMAVIIR
jgi:membrane protease YdiL (CAAX protease family)